MSHVTFCTTVLASILLASMSPRCAALRLLRKSMISSTAWGTWARSVGGRAVSCRASFTTFFLFGLLLPSMGA